jgi:hypothetical protein
MSTGGKEASMQARIKKPNDLAFWGVDLKPEARPGVPRETPPYPLHGTHWTEPPPQPTHEDVVVRAGLTRPTPVFSTALPPRGVSGALRRVAHRIPDHRLGHWFLLLLADRVDVVQNLPALIKGTGRRAAKRSS